MSEEINGGYVAISGVSGEFALIRPDELERLRGIEARLREVYDAYVAEESLELDDVLERQRLQYYLTGEV